MLSAGRTFGRYLIVREIGRGGMGAVFEARHQQLHKRVALKTLHSAALDPRSIERFLREGRAAASLAHPHVVDVWDVGVEDGTPFIVMELLDGEDLAARIARAAPLSVEATIDVALPVLAAVAAMHDKGVVHRDLKPENIFLSKGLGGQDVPKVLDFGVCLGVESDARRLTDGGIVGTPDYLSPEQVEGASGDPKSDQHALGVILFEALTARRPYQAPTLLGLLAAIRDGRRPTLRELRADAPAGLAVAVERALDVDPSRRFEDVRALARALIEHGSDARRAEWRAVFSAETERPSTPAPAPSRVKSVDPAVAPLAVATLRFGSPLSEQQPEHTQSSEPRNRSARAAIIVVAAVAATLVATISLIAAREAPKAPSAQPAPGPPPAAPLAQPPPAEPAPPAQRAPTEPQSSPSIVTLVAPPTQRAATARGRPRPRASVRAPSATTVEEPAVNAAPIVD